MNGGIQCDQTYLDLIGCHTSFQLFFKVTDFCLHLTILFPDILPFKAGRIVFGLKKKDVIVINLL